MHDMISHEQSQSTHETQPDYRAHKHRNNPQYHYHYNRYLEHLRVEVAVVIHLQVVPPFTLLAAAALRNLATRPESLPLRLRQRNSRLLNYSILVCQDVINLLAYTHTKFSQ